MTEQNHQLAVQTGAIQTYEQMEAASIKLAESKLMGDKTTPAMVFGLMLLCQCEGLNPVAAMKRYHVIEGKPSMRADAMQAEFLAHGGGIIWHVRTDDMVAATLFADRASIDDASRKRATERFEILWELDTAEPDQKSALMVKAAKLSMEGEETLIRTFADCQAKGITEGAHGTKTNWKTSPRQMLTARVITEGVRLVNPGLIAGIYSEDETADIVRQEKQEQAKMLAEPTVHDRAAIEAIIDQHMASAAEAKTDAEKRRYLGLAAELRCKLGDIDPTPTATTMETQAAPAEPAQTEKPAKVPKPKADKPAAAKPWREVICHVGSAGGTVNGKTLAEILKLDASPKHHDSMLSYFLKQVGELQAPDAKDADLWRAVSEWNDEWHAAQKPAGEPTAPAQASEKPAQQPAASTDWHDFILESKDAKLNGRKLGDLNPEEMKAIHAYLGAIDRSKMTIYQRKLVAMMTLTSTVEPELPEHVKALDRKLKESNIKAEDFLTECRNAGWIDINRPTVTSITEAEAKPMLGDWQNVEAVVYASYQKLPGV